VGLWLISELLVRDTIDLSVTSNNYMVFMPLSTRLISGLLVMDNLFVSYR
jgi:hypothetical protein